MRPKARRGQTVYVSVWEGVAARDLGRRAPGGVLEKGPWLSQVGGRDWGGKMGFTLQLDGKKVLNIKRVFFFFPKKNNLIQWLSEMGGGPGFG